MQSSLRVVLLQDGRGLNHELVRAGLAWMYRRYTNDHSVNDLEEEARVARYGLWADPNPIPPWEWGIARKNPHKDGGQVLQSYIHLMPLGVRREEVGLLFYRHQHSRSACHSPFPPDSEASQRSYFSGLRFSCLATSRHEECGLEAVTSSSEPTRPLPCPFSSAPVTERVTFCRSQPTAPASRHPARLSHQYQ